MQGTIQTIDVKHRFGFLRDATGAKVFFRRSALTPPERFATLEIGMRVEFEPASGPKGLRTAKITVTPLETPPVLLFEALAAYFHRHAAS
jgi:cold shock CspA family protein